MKNITILLFLITLLVMITGCASDHDREDAKLQKDTSSKTTPTVEITVSAAISLTDALEEIKTLYEKENHVNLKYIFGGSGKLAQQILQGAPVDVFLSANEDWMDKLENENLLVDGTRFEITGNKIVMITGKDSRLNYDSINDINTTEIKQIAIGNPDSVPAGQYTEQLLMKMDKWTQLKNHIVLTQDVRQVLTYVETGNVDIGFVYESDAISSDTVKVLTLADNRLHDPIIYPAAVLKNTKYEKQASDFVTFMGSDEAQEILLKHGFRK